MPMDSLCMAAVMRECEPALVGGRIDKIYQPSRDEVVLQVRGTQGAARLLLSANPSRPRLQMTALNRENPAQPPMFCMLLRKYLAGGRIISLRQPPRERMAELLVETADEMGDRVERSLILEAMGRRANLVLVDSEGRIVDCLRRTGGDLSSARPLLPGMFYIPPEPQADRLDPVEMTETERESLLLTVRPDMPADRWLLDTFRGISPLLAREIIFDVFGQTDAAVGSKAESLLERLLQVCAAALSGSYTPTVLVRDGMPADFSFRPILQYGPAGESRPAESFAALLDRFYGERETAERVKNRGQDFIRTLTAARDRLNRKMALQAKELAQSADRDKYRIYGELITANLYRMEKGQRTLEADNYYDPECRPITIPLDAAKSPQQNAARYFKLYTKARTAEKMLTEQLAKGREELEYLESVLDSLSRAEGDRDLEEIRQELSESGYLRRRPGAKEKMKRPSGKPLEFHTSSGLRVSVGRNNLQNDRLTTKLAGKWDYWFHTQKIHGAHVILWTEGSEPDEASLNEAARIAAYYSQARGGSKIPVDYTPVRYVKKPAGARPGMVVYTTYKTAYVDAVEPESVK